MQLFTSLNFNKIRNIDHDIFMSDVTNCNTLLYLFLLMVVILSLVSFIYNGYSTLRN